MAIVLSSVSVKLRAGRLSSFWISLTRLVDLLDRHLQVARDGLVVVLLEVVEVLVDDRELEVVGAEDLGLHEQALAEIARAHADRVELLHDAEDLGRVFRVEAGLVGQLLDRQIGGAGAVLALDALEVEVALVVEVADDQLGEATLAVAEVAHLQLPHQVLCTLAGRLREVLLDGRELFEAAAAGRQRGLEGAVLEELLPVDLLHLLVLGALGHVDVALEALGLTDAFLDGLLGVQRAGARAVGVVAGAGVDFVIGQDRIGVELLANLVDELEARKLQEANRLLQLRRHDQLLAQLELLLDFHS